MGDSRMGGTAQDRARGLWLALDASEKPIVLDENNPLLGSPRDSLPR
jgi:hypothetical protein